MSGPKHTPGPWTAEMHGETYWIGVPAVLGVRVVAEVDTGFVPDIDAEQHANARLIARAPQMAELLNQLAGPASLTRDDIRELALAELAAAGVTS